MKLAPTLLLKDKEKVPFVEGRITEIFRPSKPSPAQEKHGIHPQDLVITGEDDVAVKIQLMSEGMHLSPKEKGNTIRISCTQGDRGPSGLTVNIYAPEGKPSQFKLIADKFASISITEAGQQKADTKAQDVKQPGVTGRTPHTKPTLLDHANCLYDLTAFFAGRLVGKGFGVGEFLKAGTDGQVDSLSLSLCDLALRAATTVYIQASKDGLIAPMGNEPMKAMEAAEAGVAQQAEKKADPKKIIYLITKDVIDCKVDAQKADRAISANGLSWETIYDRVVQCLRGLKITQEAIDMAHDEFRAIAIKTPDIGLNEEKFYRFVCGDFATFKETCEQNCEPGPTSQGMGDSDDEIPM